MVINNLNEALATASGCIVCRESAIYRVGYRPDNSQEYGAPPSKTRYCIYGV